MHPARSAGISCPVGRLALITLASGSVSRHAAQETAWREERRRILAEFLTGQGFEVVQPPGGTALASIDAVPLIAGALAGELPDGLVLFVPHTAAPRPAMALTQALGVPVALFAEDDPAWGGAQGLLRCAEMIRSGAGRWGRLVWRLLGDLESLTAWARAMTARGELHRGAALLWGGPRDAAEEDVTVFRGRAIGELYAEEMAVLKERAGLLAGARYVATFDKWLRKAGLEIQTEKEGFTLDAWRSQLALLAAARERLGEIGGKFPVLSVAVNTGRSPGVDAAALLSLLPFGEGPEGPTPVVPTVAGGDIKSLLAAAFLGRLGRRTPPLFAAIAHVSGGTITLTAAGGASVWWAMQSHEAAKVFKRVTVLPDLTGHGAGAWSFLGTEMKLATVVQFGQQAGAPTVAVGLAKPQLVTAIDRKGRSWGASWPLLKFTGSFDPAVFAERGVGENLLALPGEWVREVAAWALIEGFHVVDFGNFQPWERV